MREYLNFKPLKNTEIARVVGKSEGTIRNAKKNAVDVYNRYLLDAKKELYPFWTLDEMAKIKEKDRDILKEKLSQIDAVEYQKANNKEEIYYQFNILEMTDLRDEYRDFNKTNVISIINRKGGVAKTTNSINLATALSKAGFNVLFVDYDTQANASQSFGIRPKLHDKPFIIDLILKAGKAELTKEEAKDAIVHMSDKLHSIGKFDLIPNAGDIKTRELSDTLQQELELYGTTVTALNELLSLIKDDYDFVIIDTPPNDNSVSFTMLVMATDHFIISYKPQREAIEGTSMIFSHLKEKLEKPYKLRRKKPISLLGGIISEYDERVKIENDYAKECEEEFSYYIDKFNLPKKNKIFPQKIKKLQIFKKISNQAYLGSLFSPFALKGGKNEILGTNELFVIKSYLEIASQVVESIIIDCYAQEN